VSFVLARLVKVRFQIGKLEDFLFFGSFRLAAGSEAEAAALGNSVAIGNDIFEVQVDHEPEWCLEGQ
jgi:hypothetical protein